MPGTNLTREEASRRAELITVDSYDIALDLTTGDQRFSSRTIIEFSSARAGASTFVDLVVPHVSRLELNGVDLDPETVYVDSRIELSSLELTNTLVVDAEAAYSRTGEGLHRFTDPADDETYTYSQCETADARRIFACFEQPDLKSRFTLHVVAPPDWTVISNQPGPTPRLLGDKATWDFDESPTMSTYLFAVIAGPYSVWSDSYTSSDGRKIPLGLFVRKSMAQYVDVENIIDVTRRGFEFFEQAFKIPYPYVKYDQIFVPEYNFGAMENIGAVTLTEDHYIHRSKPLEADVAARTNTILHEQAHMWFGNLVTMTWWNDLWLNESFAEFMAHYASVGNTRWTQGWTDFNATRKLVGYQQDQLPTTHPVVADIRDLGDVFVNFDMITYAKGASVLKQLVARVGEEAFLAGVHRYLTKYAEANATLADFLAEIEAASSQNLGQWSQMWLEEAGVTTLRPVITETDQGTYDTVTIAQEPAQVYSRFAEIPHRDLPEISVNPSLRPHTIDIAGYHREGGKVVRRWSVQTVIDGESTCVDQLTGKEIPDILLINDRDLTFAKIRLDFKSRAAVPNMLALMEDSLPRALLWGSLWDSVRDGELPAREYIQIVLSALQAETHSMTLLSVLTRLRTAVLLYVSATDRTSTHSEVAARLLEFTRHAEVGSDQQLQFFKAFTALACTDSQLDELAGILDGSITVPGLVVDTEVRWEALTALVAAGRLDDQDIEAELARDATLSGRERAAGASAAIPTLEAKRQAWRKGVFDDTISNATQRHILAGFSKVRDPELLRGFAGEYFSVIEQVWETRSVEMRQNIVKSLYPLRLADDPQIDILAMTDDWLNDLGARIPALRRLVLASREEVICARIAQRGHSS